jgi:hypothetical protein
LTGIVGSLQALDSKFQAEERNLTTAAVGGAPNLTTATPLRAWCACGVLTAAALFSLKPVFGFGSGAPGKEFPSRAVLKDVFS